MGLSEQRKTSLPLNLECGKSRGGLPVVTWQGHGTTEGAGHSLPLARSPLPRKQSFLGSLGRGVAPPSTHEAETHSPRRKITPQLVFLQLRRRREVFVEQERSLAIISFILLSCTSPWGLLQGLWLTSREGKSVFRGFVDSALELSFFASKPGGFVVF